MFQSLDIHQNSKLGSYPRLLGDIGGTNARFGWQEAVDSPIEHVKVLPCAAFISLQSAIEHYLSSLNLQKPSWASLGIANPVNGDAISMTNHHWKFSVNEVRENLGLSRLVLLNDFTALALALPFLHPDYKNLVDPDGTTSERKNSPIGLIGPGTGLGVSGLIPHQDRWLPISGEGGHVTLTPTTPLEFDLIQRLRKRYGHVSAERVLSGPGLIDTFQSLSEIKGEETPEIQNSAEILTIAHEEGHSTASETLNLFCSFLGCTAGNLALTLGARGGVYLGGGIVPRMIDWLKKSEFRQRFEAKGRFGAYLKEVPVWVIDSPAPPALQGAAEALKY